MKSYNIIPKPAWELLLPIDFKTMYELGNKKNKNGVFKTQFEQMQIDHISIDWNGLDGALPLDLSKPINMESRDMVTNLGTTEHVINNQEQVFRNIHNLSHYRIIHALPRINQCIGHGGKCWHFDLDFFNLLAEINDYTIEKLYIGNKYPREVIRCSYRKNNDNKFKWSNKLKMVYQ